MKRFKDIFIILTCFLMWAMLLSGWTYTLNISTPAGGDDPREADDRIREVKAAFVERLDIDHYFAPSATSVYDAADTGKHRYVTFREPNDLTAMSADESALFSKDVNSVTELHWIDESDNVLQLTSEGYLYGNNLLAGSVLTAAIADANITLPLMADECIDSNQYVDGSIYTAHIADANITAVKIANLDPDSYAGEESVTFANGLIIKMGYEAIGATTGTVTFGAEFPNAAVSVGTTLRENAGTLNTLTVSAAISKTGFDWRIGDSGMDGFYWIALGY